MHELTHYLSHTDCEPAFAVHHASEDPTTVEFHEQHEHCKFLQLLSVRQVTPFTSGNIQPTVISLNLKTFIPAKVQIWISNTPNSYYQARAPPVV